MHRNITNKSTVSCKYNVVFLSVSGHCLSWLLLGGRLVLSCILTFYGTNLLINQILFILGAYPKLILLISIEEMIDQLWSYIYFKDTQATS